MSYLDNKKFVSAYIKAFKNNQTSVEVARAVGTTQKKVYQKANELRKRGVKLPILAQAKAQSKYYTTEELNALIEKNM